MESIRRSKMGLVLIQDLTNIILNDCLPCSFAFYALFLSLPLDPLIFLSHPLPVFVLYHKGFGFLFEVLAQARPPTPFLLLNPIHVF